MVMVSVEAWGQVLVAVEARDEFLKEKKKTGRPMNKSDLSLKYANTMYTWSLKLAISNRKANIELEIISFPNLSQLK